MKINLKSLLYLPLIFLFLPSFSIYIPILKGVYSVFFFILYTIILVLLINHFSKSLKKIITVYKKTPIKIFIYFFILVSLNAILLSLIGTASLYKSLRSIIFQWLLFIFPIILYYILILENYIQYKKFIKIFVCLLWINFIIGFISYLGQLFNIEFINKTFDFFANERFLINDLLGFLGLSSSNFLAYGIPRLDNLFDEPSGYAQFIFIFLPFIYSFSSIKEKLVNNFYIDRLIKKTLIPFAWISIILTFSPIYLILCLINTIIYYHKQIIKSFIKYFIVYISTIATIIFYLSSIDLSETYLSRIINVITQIHSFEDFIAVEPSLATRIASYINCFYVFLHHPFLGVGFGNIMNHLYSQYLHSPVPLTPEIISKTQIMMTTVNRPFCNANYIYTLLAENGIIICSFLFYFIFKLFKTLNLIIIFINNNFEKALAKALKYSLIAIIIISFYNLRFLNIYVYLIIALIIMFIYKYRASGGGHV